MYLVIGILTVLCVLTGIYNLLKHNKINGILRVVVAIICPIIAIWLCSLKESRVYGGNDWEFIVHSATVDGDIYPWILLILLVVEVIIVVETVLKLLKSKNTH